MTTTILSVALSAEGVVLLGLLAVVLQLRARLARVTGASTAAVAQMNDLVREAQTLSASLTGQIAEQASLCEALTERVEEATALSQRAAPVVEAPARAARSTAKTASATEVAAPARSRRKSLESEEPAVEEKAPARSRSRKNLAADAAPAYDPQADVAAAREKGMDPIAIAVQRNLANKQHAFTA